jgi:DNA-binding NtrC family response regulator
VTLSLPPLRERREDIPALISRFLSQAAERAGRQIEFTPSALERMVNYEWLGNVRQLQHTVQRLAALSASGLIQESDLPPEIVEAEGESEGPILAMEGLVSYQEMERRYLVQVLAATQGNKLQAARIMNLDRKTVDRMVRTHEIDVESFKARSKDLGTKG